jgi:hypothetical protein
MSLSRHVAPLLSLLAPALLLSLGTSTCHAQGCPSCGSGGVMTEGCPPPVPVPGTPACGKPCCGQLFCCPKFYHCQEKPPIIKIKRVCSKPVCDPCHLEGYGYYPVCWRPMGPLNYNHCPTPAPAVLAQPPKDPNAPQEEERKGPPEDESKVTISVRPNPVPLPPTPR